MPSEQAVVFDCVGERLLGILTSPDSNTTVGVLIVVGGAQYRAGSHRQFVLLARALAAEGYPCFRFDCRGMGDSTGQAPGFAATQPDIACAIDAFVALHPALQRIVLWGLCDAASAGLLYWQASRDSRVAGIVLLNPWVRSPQTLARTQVRHYYGQRLLTAEFWRKLLTGKVAVLHSLRDLFTQLVWVLKKNKPPQAGVLFQQGMHQALRDFPGSVLLILSGSDYTAREFAIWLEGLSDGHELFARPNRYSKFLPEADHTFARADWRQQVESMTIRMLVRLDEPVG